MYESFEPEEDERPTLPMWGTIDRSPTTRTSAPAANFVAPVSERRLPPAPYIDAPIVDTAAAWESKPSVIETGTPVHRAVATLIRSAPIVVLLIVLGVPATWLVMGAWDWVYGVAVMAGFGLVGILAVTYWDLEHNSPSSTERHRIDKAFQLKRQELRQTHELRRAIVEAYIDHLEDTDHA